jgi:hypothetical protein
MTTFINNEITKTSTEIFSISFNFAELLATSDTIASGTVSAKEIESNIDFSTGSSKVINSTTATVSGTSLVAELLNGVSGRDYKITFLATTTGGDVLSGSGVMRVRD